MNTITSTAPQDAATAARGPAGPGGSLVGTRRLVRLIVRRDRIRLALWIVGLVALMGVSAQSIAAMYDTPLQIATYVDTVGDNPALVVFGGPGYGFDQPNGGVILVNETSLWMALGSALMGVFLVNRHTRAEEESERADLIRALVVGHHAPLVATLIVAAAATTAVAAGSTIAVLAFGFPVAGTIALCGSVGLVGFTFAAATAVAVQVADTGRAALGLGAGLTGVAYVVRGIGDVSVPGLAWTTPFGWGIGVRAFAGERWWTFLGLAAFAAALVALALALSVRRDLGSGLLAQRLGPAEASAGTRHPLGLATRLQRNVVSGWLVGVVATGLVYGSIADDIEALVADNPELADYLTSVSGATLTESYLATSLRLLALVIAGFAISSALRSRAEEAAGCAESMLATPVSRWWWAGSHVVVTVVATLLLTLASGLAIGIAHAASVGDRSEVGPLVAASLATVPGVLVFAGLATMVFGWWPRATAAAWGVFALAAVVSLFGAVLRLPSWAVDLSPIELAPAVPAEPWDAVPLAVLAVVAVGLFAAGLVGFRRRDLAAA